MRFILTLLFTLLSATTLFAEVTMHKSIPRPVILPIEEPEHPIVRPPHIRPIVNTGIVYQDNYYNTNNVNSCQQYIDQVATLNQKINTLQREVDRLQSKEDARLQKTLQEKNKKELEAFDNRKSSVKTTNSIEITDK